MEFAAKQFDPSVCWDDLAWIRGLWRGPILVKGLVSAPDIAIAITLALGAGAVLIGRPYLYGLPLGSAAWRRLAGSLPLLR